jgi:hypothetical protein
VASLYVMSFLGVSPLGALASGWIAEHWTPPIALAACGIAALAASAAYASQYPKIRLEIRAAYKRLGILPNQ